MNAEPRSVVFIGGTSYSGSTALCLMLGHGPDCFAAGEVFALFRPTRPHHREARCGCGDPACRLWRELRAAGEGNWLAELWYRRPELRSVIDSSKSVAWIEQQATGLCASGVVARKVLVWKAPAAFARSMQKRAREGWARHWVRYHLAFLTQSPGALCVSHAALCRNPSGVLEALCRTLGLRYFPGKERYWEQQHHLLFGNTSVRRHLYEPGSALALAAETQARSELQSEGGTLAPHRGSAAEADAPLTPALAAECETEPFLPELARLLEATAPIGALATSEIEAFLRRARLGWWSRLRQRLGRAAGSRRRSA